MTVVNSPTHHLQRIDVLQSSRHVRIELNGQEIANTRKPRLLFETSLPVRTYIPMTDCRLDLLKPSELTTACPYKVGLDAILDTRGCSFISHRA